MAKATATCTCKKCGKTFYKTAIKRNRDDANSWEQWVEAHCDICPECEAAERAEKAAELAKLAKEDGMPELRGSAKQCVWAEQIRSDMIAEFESLRSKASASIDPKDTAEAKRCNRQIELFDEGVDYILNNKDKASWWIDNRGAYLPRLVEAAVKEKRETAHKTELETSPAAVEAKAEETVVPESQTHDTVEIMVSDKDVAVKYPRDDAFRAIVKAADFKWDADRRVWHKPITQFTGSAIDRAADIGNALLREGFAIRCHDTDVRRMAVDGSFEPECKLWVKTIIGGDYAGWLTINITKGDHEMYDHARKIKNSRWNTSTSSVIVPVSSHELVQDFASLYGYRLSVGALDAIEKYKSKRAQAVKPATPAKPEKVDRLKEILASDDAVLGDLKDD